jgi:hypothetical protein
MREFETGATRDTDDGKLDFEGFLSPVVLEAYAKFMHENRVQRDGNLRDSDNWQRGIPRDVYVKSSWRHFFGFWKAWRAGDREAGKRDALALLFNIMGWLHEQLTLERRIQCEQDKMTTSSGTDSEVSAPSVAGPSSFETPDVSGTGFSR